MPTEAEIQRIAAAINLIRPDWSARTITNEIHKNQSHRPFGDLAIALVWVAVDPASRTPARVHEPGPWWTALVTSEEGRVHQRMHCAEHPDQPAGYCPVCATRRSLRNKDVDNALAKIRRAGRNRAEADEQRRRAEALTAPSQPETEETEAETDTDGQEQDAQV